MYTNGPSSWYMCRPLTVTHTIQPIPFGVVFSKSSFKAHGSKLRARTSLLPLFNEKSRSSFELWALKRVSENVTQNGTGCTSKEKSAGRSTIIQSRFFNSIYYVIDKVSATNRTLFSNGSTRASSKALLDYFLWSNESNTNQTLYQWHKYHIYQSCKTTMIAC